MSTKVMTPEAFLSYPHLAAPQAARDGQGKPKYSVSLVLPAGTDLAPFIAAATEAAEEKWGTKAKTMIATGAISLKGGKGSTIRTDSAGKGYPEGSVFINARTEQQPGMVFRHAGPDGKTPAVIPQDKIATELYPGARVRATLRAFAYDTAGNKGVSFALNNLQKLGDGPRLDGRTAATEEFDVDLSAAPADLTTAGAQ